MGRIVTAYQPHYYPRLHYLARAQQADVFVIYDDVEFSRQSSQHRAPIDYYEKEWLSVPVRHTGVDTTLEEARIDMSEPWPVTHLKTLVGKYGKPAEELAPFYERLCPPPVDVDSLRENADEVAALVDADSVSEGADETAVLVTDSSDGVVDACLRWDDQRRERERELDGLQAEKQRIGSRISDRKRSDPAADIDDLVSAADAVEDRLVDVETAYREAKERRDRALLKISDRLDGLSDRPGDDSVVERSPIERLWDLDGVDPDERLSDVRLVDLTVPLLRELLRRFDVAPTVVRSSEVDVEHPGDPSEYLAGLTERLGGDCYLSGGVGYENYLDEAPFDARGLDVLVQDWTPRWEDGNVCALDVLFAAEEPGTYVRP